LRPTGSSFDEIPNGNDPASVPPATVGPPAAEPGDPDGVQIDVGGGTTSGLPPVRPMPWSGWPAEWATPNWQGHVEQLTDTAWTCLDLNASILATMPPYMVGAAPSTPADWINNPDPDVYASWEEFAKQLFWDYQLGEAFILATARYSTGYPARFHVVEPWMVDAEIGGSGLRRYRIGRVDVTADMLHVRYKTTTGDAHGHGPLEAGRARMVAASVLHRYAATLAGTGGIPSSVLEHPDELTAEAAALLQQQWVEARMSGIGLPAVLSGGVTWRAVQLNPNDMALVELSQFNDSRIAVMLGVPPFLVGLPSGGDSMTYSNVSAIFDYHWRAGLRPKAHTVMSALSGWLLPRGTRVEVNRDEYVQPEPYTRAQTAEIYNRIRDDLGRPVLSVDEIRAAERFSNSAPADLSGGVLR
jgi:HK97 family phage portal protein